MALTPEARREIVEEAKHRALKDMGKPESELNGEEKRQAGSLANDYAVQMLKDAHDFKIRVADLDADKYAFEKVFAEDLQNTPYAQSLNDDANLEEDFSSQVDENARYGKVSVPQNAGEFDFVPDVRDDVFVKDLLRDFGNPVLVKTKENFKDAGSAVDEIYSKIKPLNGAIRNEETGWDIHISKDEIKKFVKMKPKSAWGVLYSLPEFIQRAKYDGIRPDRHGRDNVIYHRFFANADAGNGEIPIVISVREILDKDGYKKYYDLSLVENKKRADTARRVFHNQEFPVKALIIPHNRKIFRKIKKKMQNIQKFLMKRRKSQTESIVNFMNATRMETKKLTKRR